MEDDLKSMGATLQYDTWDVVAPVLMPAPFRPEALSRRYPRPDLAAAGGTQTRTVRTVVMQNPWMEITVCPELGGRIVGWHDRRTGLEVLPRAGSIELDDRLAWAAGLTWCGGRAAHEDGLAECEVMLREPAAGEDPAGVFLHGLAVGTPLEWTGCLTLDPFVAELTLDLRLHNRSLSPHLAVGGWVIHTGPGELCQLPDGTGYAFYSSARDTGLLLFTDLHRMAAWHDGEALHLTIGEREPYWMGGRQIDQLRVSIQPLSGLGSLVMANRQAALGIRAKRVAIQVPDVLEAQTLFVLVGDESTGRDQTLQAPADLTPAEVWRSDLAGVPGEVTGFLMRSSHQEAVLRWDAEFRLDPSARLGNGLTWSPGTAHVWMDSQLDLLSEGAYPSFSPALAVPGMQAVACIAQSLVHLRQEEWAEADRWLDRALGFNAEDHLVWWLRAVIQRERGQADDDRPELLNAHYLAPLEPALRAEAYLSTPQATSKEPSPLAAALAAHPDAACDVACLLLEAGLHRSLARLVDELLRHQENPMLRYLLASVLLTDSRMEATASEHVVLAGKAGARPPFAWRRAERQAIHLLAERFPADETLALHRQLVEAYEKTGPRY